MQVVASEQTREAIQQHGGRLYVWVRKGRRCCGGLRTLTTAVEPHPDVEFRRTDYDREKAAARIRASSWPEAAGFAAGNVLSVPSVEDAMEFFRKHGGP